MYINAIDSSLSQFSHIDVFLCDIIHECVWVLHWDTDIHIVEMPTTTYFYAKLTKNEY
jgi:hypothetical protein